MAEVDSVFVGRVISQDVRDPGEPFSSRVFRFEATEVFKGEVSGRIVTVLTGADGALCGVGFEVGQSYLVYARNSAGDLWTGLCDRTVEVSGAAEDLQVLRVPTPAVDLRVRLEEDSLHFVVEGGAGRTFILEATRDLLAWEPLIRVSPSSQLYAVPVSFPTLEGSFRFYRLTEPEPPQGIYGMTIFLPGVCLEDPEEPGVCQNLPFPGRWQYDVREFANAPDLGQDNPILAAFESSEVSVFERISGDYTADLDNQLFTSALRSSLAEVGISLSSDTEIDIQTRSRTWILRDPQQQLAFFVEHNGVSLTVVNTGSFRVPLPEGEFCLWGQFGCDRQVSIGADEWQFVILQVALP